MATEKRLIDAKALLRRICNERDEIEPKTAYDIGYHNGLNMAASMAISAPTVDAVEVVHGRWIGGYSGTVYTDPKCSQCGYGNRNVGAANYCPNCGADMRERKGKERK